MKRLLLVLLIPVFMLSGCDKFLDVVPEEDMTTLNSILKHGIRRPNGFRVVTCFCRNRFHLLW